MAKDKTISASSIIKDKSAAKVMQQNLALPGDQSLTNAITLDTITKNSTRQAAEAKAGVSEDIAVKAAAPSGMSDIEIAHRHTSSSGGRLVNFSFALSIVGRFSSISCFLLPAKIAIMGLSGKLFNFINF